MIPHPATYDSRDVLIRRCTISRFPIPGSTPNRQSGSTGARRPRAAPCALPQPAADPPPPPASGQGPPGRPAVPDAYPLRDEGDGTLSLGSGRPRTAASRGHVAAFHVILATARSLPARRALLLAHRARPRCGAVIVLPGVREASTKTPRRRLRAVEGDAPSDRAVPLRYRASRSESPSWRASIPIAGAPYGSTPPANAASHPIPDAEPRDPLPLKKTREPRSPSSTGQFARRLRRRVVIPYQLAQEHHALDAAPILQLGAEGCWRHPTGNCAPGAGRDVRRGS